LNATWFIQLMKCKGKAKLPLCSLLRCVGSGGDHWGDLGVDGWIILEWISRTWNVGIGTGAGWPKIVTGGGRL